MFEQNKEERYFEIQVEEFFLRPEKTLSKLVGLKLKLFKSTQSKFLYSFNPVNKQKEKIIQQIFKEGAVRRFHKLSKISTKELNPIGSFMGTNYFRNPYELFKKSERFGPLFLIYDSKKYFLSENKKGQYNPLNSCNSSEGLLALILIRKDK